MSGARVTLRGIHHTYQGTRGHTEAVRGLDLEAKPGEFVAIVGPSGCGKSTLLHFVAGLDKPQQGTVEVDDKPVTGADASRIMVFQQAALFPWLDVAGNIGFGLRQAGVGNGDRKQRIQDALEMVELTAFAKSRIHELSGGMKQRVALARALVLQPRVLLMDEPFAALDAMSRGRLQEEVARLWERTRPTVLFVTHDVHEAAMIADRIVVMSARPGRAIGSVEVALGRPRWPDDHAVADAARSARQLLQDGKA